MRGSKSSHYDGGHRVFGFLYYPAAGIKGGYDVGSITAHNYIMPTLLELCGIPVPDSLMLDGRSIVPLLTGSDHEWPERTIFLHNQRVQNPLKWKDTSVMTGRWRLIGNTELYDMSTDPGQQHNVIDRYPEIAQYLREQYDKWWDDISSRFNEVTPLYIVSDRNNPVQLNANDWMIPDVREIPRNQRHVVGRPESKNPWQVRVTRPGWYEFILRERPESAAFTLTAVEARLQIGENINLVKSVFTGSTGVSFQVDLEEGDTIISTWLIDADGRSRGAYYVDVYRLECSGL